MFTSLSDKLKLSFDKLKGQTSLTEENVQSALRDIRVSLLEADVALPVVKSFIANIKEKALGEEVKKSLTPDQTFVSFVKKELEKALGEEAVPINLKAQPPAVILMAGLQGAGKTTSTAKLAKYLKEQHKKKVMVVSADIYRPAAIDQLETLAKSVDVEFYPSDISQKPDYIVTQAIQAAKTKLMDVVIVDTAGRLHIDESMMDEIKLIHKIAKPVETFFTVDSMTGQDAAVTAKAFNDALALTGIILTKTDGDARGGAALSIREITGKPIKFLGVGEKTDALEPFHPDRVASKIIGMGDVLSLIESIEQKTEKESAQKLTKKLKSGKNFDLNDFKAQISQMKNIGGVESIMSKLPNMPANMPGNIGDDMFKKIEALIDSMTPLERKKPELIKHSRKQRIIKGSGTTIQDLNKLLQQHTQMKKMMKSVVGKKGGMANMMKRMAGMQGMGNMANLLGKR
ncbi:signal recognition particle protein [Francisella adeliensis]|uniref:Signal recognition particle protein n=1 Tax=Francisella adeliensis TaxID=2007306 RepID=A0A2Z4XYI0_9GAMM|nr:signal recognition particle protein [Francisella adeliensis]AXA33957.1 signal recognition particle protein [Francisella adeliensis]MBK2085866.1 signal recognition particle protein [Francisella adeliensis]MBK2097744.1 signal recognition particle protein [Francisella adeliensis]QIW12193.1 signal recognition particle protein [Francisella adeliensis]QIW14069.1 signal recognition particle protein [Francisella adeliensis]